MTDWIPEMHIAPNQPDGWMTMRELDVADVIKTLSWPFDVQLETASVVPEDFHCLEIISLGFDLTTVAGGGNRRIGLIHRDSNGFDLTKWYAQSTQAGGLTGGRYDFQLGLAYATPIVGTNPATSRESLPLIVLQPGHTLILQLFNNTAGDALQSQIRGRVLVRP